MNATNHNYEKFQILLRELFQYDCADLDFGIYRIMNYKRKEIEKFIDKDLLKTVNNELERGALADHIITVEEFEKVKEKVIEILGKNCIDGDENLTSFHDTPLGTEYLAKKEKKDAVISRELILSNIFSHLYSFFSRYYQDGDFISKRRYSKRHKYAIPYNGEEVHLHWANSDQYYVKSTEHFHNYTFTSHGVVVDFKLETVNVEQNNNKGKKRFFLPRVTSFNWDETNNHLVIPFEYRPLSEQEEIIYNKKQEKINNEAAIEIPKHLSKLSNAMLALTTDHPDYSDEISVSTLEHHLRQYTRRNTSDFFIHKDLKSFLNRELDFYLKNEVLDLDELERVGESRSGAWFQLLRLTKSVGNRVIEFLAQIENFQKMLWEKRKFVTEAQYCITIGNVDETLYPAILENTGQWKEWQELYGVDESDRNIKFLQSRPTLVVDTMHFDREFVDDLLSTLCELDDTIDGLLVHGDNWQALNLLQERYNQNVQCVYIDPPYNTAASEIIYKNNYKHSSWLTFIFDRISIASTLLDIHAAWVVAIDDTEMVGLAQLLDSTMKSYDRNMVVVNHHPAGSGLEGTNISSTHEYAIFMTPAGLNILRGEKKPDEVNKIGFVRTGTAESNLRSGRPNSFYAFLINPETSEIVGVEPPPSLSEMYPVDNTDEGFIRIYPVSSDGTERVWRRSFKTIQSCLENGEVVCRNNKSIYLVKDQIGKRRPLFSNWTDKKYNAGAHGSNLLKDLFGTANNFSYPKSIYTVRDCIEACIHQSDDAVVLDYFAGSGTTGHAIINLNREDGGCRKFILVEMENYFDSVLLPRIKKTCFAPDWRNGKPLRLPTQEEIERTPRVIKYIKLESYEDSLNNIEYEFTGERRLLKLENYFLKYFLNWETRSSNTLLNIENLSTPFQYKLQIHCNGKVNEKYVDIPETFNYLIGLHVEKRQIYNDDSKRYLVYRGHNRHQKIVVIWRETKDWISSDLERDKQFVCDKILKQHADIVYVNCESIIPNAQALDSEFKNRMFAPVEI